MIGFSIFLNQDVTPETEAYIRTMKKSGFSEIFTSMHIPEDDSSQYRIRIEKLGQICQQEQLKLTVDISAQAIEKVGFSFDRPTELQAIGITGLRMDYGIPFAKIAQLSQKMFVALNASTITLANLAELKAHQANFDHMEAWHNYYPRPETGLDDLWLTEKNQWLHQQGFQTMAFVPGNEQLRGPLFEGLPTLESQRTMHPLASTIILQKEQATDKVFIGDPRIDASLQRQFARYQQQKIILLHVNLMQSAPLALNQRLFHNRQDVARDVVRLEEARFELVGATIVATTKMARKRGSLTVDNQLYGRYQGEMQLVKFDLPSDERVNVLGRVIPDDLDLLTQIEAGGAIEFSVTEKE